MSDYFNLQAGDNSPGLFLDDCLLGSDGLFDFDAASEVIDHCQSRDRSPVGEERHFDDLSDDDGLYDETVGSAGDINDEELVGEEEGVTRADGVLSWKIEHSSGDHKLKGI